MSWIREAGGAVYLRVKVQPRAAHNQAAGVEGDCLKLRVTAPPVDGRANAACRELLAGLLGVRPGAVQITAGEHSRTKEVRIAGCTADRVREMLTGSLT